MYNACKSTGKPRYRINLGFFDCINLGNKVKQVIKHLDGDYDPLC